MPRPIRRAPQRPFGQFRARAALASARAFPSDSRQASADFAYPGGRTGDLVAGARLWPSPTRYRPVRTFDLPALDERSVGALMMHFVLETILAARHLGVGPADQPAVERANTLARRKLAALPRS
jgi:glucose-6-phosphate isomerase